MTREELAEQHMRDAWGTVLGSEEGRAVIWSILQATFLFDQTHVGDALDGFRAGMREVGLQVVRNRIQPAGFDVLGTLQREAAERADRFTLAAKDFNQDEDFIDE
ncbi:hypothetical protein [Paracoccus sp. SM22M-07]|uniref:Bbp19 family protein n=1 Tax=Paracoccus sp. SM22M-07 TaxID=1520813 RepID=UPI0009217E85|nr:hypothetical protein [Paracoccus sp. SM22M-07]OJH45183.1 hypothetical protein IE00_05860 [Paracoccus sp. SM22M-07]